MNICSISILILLFVAYAECMRTNRTAKRIAPTRMRNVKILSKIPKVNISNVEEPEKIQDSVKDSSGYNYNKLRGHVTYFSDQEMNENLNTKMKDPIEYSNSNSELFDNYSEPGTGIVDQTSSVDEHGCVLVTRFIPIQAPLHPIPDQSSPGLQGYTVIQSIPSPIIANHQIPLNKYPVIEDYHYKSQAETQNGGYQNDGFQDGGYVSDEYNYGYYNGQSNAVIGNIQHDGYYQDNLYQNGGFQNGRTESERYVTNPGNEFHNSAPVYNTPNNYYYYTENQDNAGNVDYHYTNPAENSPYQTSVVHYPQPQYVW